MPKGRIVAPGTPGELLTRGYSVMRGYWADAANTRAAIDAARWMHTGDLATVDNAGYCNIVGRIKDMVIRGGENIYPREIEEFLYQHPDIADVQVFGVPDRLRRGALRLDTPARRRDADRGGGDALLQRRDRALQGATLRALRRRLPDDRDRQGAEIRDARDDDRGTGSRLGQNRLNSKGSADIRMS